VDRPFYAARRNLTVRQIDVPQQWWFQGGQHMRRPRGLALGAVPVGITACEIHATVIAHVHDSIERGMA